MMNQTNEMQITTNQPDQVARLLAKLQDEMAVEAKEREARKAECEAKKAYLASPEGKLAIAEQERKMLSDITRIILSVTTPTKIYDPLEEARGLADEERNSRG